MKPYLEKARKLDFPIWRNKKPINTRPIGDILIIGPRKQPFCRGKIHKTLLINKARKLHHSDAKANISRSFNKKTSDIEITPNTIGHLPPRNKASQLILEIPSNNVIIKTIDPCESPRKVINYAFKRAGNKKRLNNTNQQSHNLTNFSLRCYI
jgi:hypothetical protein